jgi:GTP-binding protein Era
VQTTRAPLRGIAVRGDVQLVLIDTPGVFAPRRRLDRAMVRAAWGALEGADAVIHIVDASAPDRAPSGAHVSAGAEEKARPRSAQARIGHQRSKSGKPDFGAAQARIGHQRSKSGKPDFGAAQARISHQRPKSGKPDLEARGPDVVRIVDTLKKTNRSAILALNKVDAMPRDALLGVAKELNETGVYSDVFMISALTGDGVEDLVKKLIDLSPPGPWLFPEDQVVDAPARVMAAEITREKLMLRLHQELPYQATVETESWQERKDGSVRIDQIIYVARESQRKIAIGEKAQTVKAIGEAARKDLERILDRRVHLFLHVKVRENWADERARYAALGLEWEA